MSRVPHRGLDMRAVGSGGRGRPVHHNCSGQRQPEEGGGGQGQATESCRCRVSSLENRDWLLPGESQLRMPVM